MNTLTKIEGQYTDIEFQKMFQQQGGLFNNNKKATGKAVLKYGRSTYNYYMQHSDGSWTNYDCKTKY